MDVTHMVHWLLLHQFYWISDPSGKRLQQENVTDNENSLLSTREVIDLPKRINNEFNYQESSTSKHIGRKLCLNVCNLYNHDSVPYVSLITTQLLQ